MSNITVKIHPACQYSKGDLVIDFGQNPPAIARVRKDAGSDVQIYCDSSPRWTLRSKKFIQSLSNSYAITVPELFGGVSNRDRFHKGDLAVLTHGGYSCEIVTIKEKIPGKSNKIRVTTHNGEHVVDCGLLCPLRHVRSVQYE